MDESVVVEFSPSLQPGEALGMGVTMVLLGFLIGVAEEVRDTVELNSEELLVLMIGKKTLL
jgi:hypothetical protein